MGWIYFLCADIEEAGLSFRHGLVERTGLLWRDIKQSVEKSLREGRWSQTLRVRQGVPLVDFSWHSPLTRSMACFAGVKRNLYDKTRSLRIR